MVQRQQIKYDIPNEWLKNREKGVCPVCAKIKDEFEKNRKVYCSQKCANKYLSRIYVWAEIRDKLLIENGKKCNHCGTTEEKEKVKRKQKYDEALDLWKKQGGLKKAKKLILKEIAKLENYFNDTEKLMKDKPYGFFEDFPFEWDFSKYERNFEVDHIVAIINGGDMFDKKNLQVLCTGCHKIKTKKDMDKRNSKVKKEKKE